MGIIEQAVELECQEDHLIAEAIDGQPCLFLAPLQRAEVGVASHLLRLLKGDLPWGLIRSGRGCPLGRAANRADLSPHSTMPWQWPQGSKLTVITGGPGVGKTTIVTSILQILQAKKMDVLLCAPTGRAAKRLTETTGLEAKTIHRLLEFEPTSMGFVHNHTNPLRADLVVVDEVSMVDVVLMSQAPPGDSR